MFFHRCSYTNSYSNQLVYNSSVLVLVIWSLNDVLKDLAFSFEELAMVYIAYLLRFETIDLLFVSKILIFEM